MFGQGMAAFGSEMAAFGFERVWRDGYLPHHPQRFLCQAELLGTPALDLSERCLHLGAALFECRLLAVKRRQLGTGGGWKGGGNEAL